MFPRKVPAMDEMFHSSPLNFSIDELEKISSYKTKDASLYFNYLGAHNIE